MAHREAFVPVNYINPEACALLAAAEGSAARRADGADAGIIALSVKGRGQLDGLYDPERILLTTAPPKRFFRIFWQSISLRLLHRWAQSALPPSTSHGSLIRRLA